MLGLHLFSLGVARMWGEVGRELAETVRGRWGSGMQGQELN